MHICHDEPLLFRRKAEKVNTLYKYKKTLRNERLFSYRQSEQKQLLLLVLCDENQRKQIVER